MNYNRVYIGGFCTRDPDVRYTPSGVAVTNIGLATNRVWKDGQGEKKEQATFVDVVCFGPVGELAARYLRKGAPAFIEGRLSLDTWEDRVTGNKRSKLKVVCENLQLLGPKPEHPPAAGGAASQRNPYLDIEPDDIPFRSTIYHDVRRSRLSRRRIL